MTFVIAFISGVGVSAVSLVLPSIKSKDSVREFETFQSKLATLPLVTSKNSHK